MNVSANTKISQSNPAPAVRRTSALASRNDWTKHLGVSRDGLQRAVDKVGNSAATVRKELGKAA